MVSIQIVLEGQRLWVSERSGKKDARVRISSVGRFPTTSNNFGNSYRLSLLAGSVSAAIYTSNEQETTISVSGL